MKTIDEKEILEIVKLQAEVNKMIRETSHIKFKEVAIIIGMVWAIIGMTKLFL